MIYCFFFALIVLLLGACDKQKDPLPGKRESFLLVQEGLNPDPALKKTPLRLLDPVLNLSWPQGGGNASHNMPHVSLKDNLKEFYNVQIGTGSSSEQRLISNIVISQNAVFTMDAVGNVSAFSLGEGKLLWSFSSSPEGHEGETLGGGIAYDRDKVYISTSFGEVICLESDNGKMLWRHHVISPMRTAPTIDRGRIFIVTINNELMVLRADTGEQLWSHAGITEAAGLLGAANPAVKDDVVVVVYSSGEVYSLKVENGHMLWSDILTSALRLDSVSSISHIRARPIIDEDFVYVISHGGRMIALDLKTGIRQWQKDIGGVRAPAVHKNGLFVLTNNNDLVAIHKKTGQIYWAVSLPKLTSDKARILYAGPILAGNALILTGSNNKALFVSPADGKILKELSLPDACLLSPIVVQEMLLILTDSGHLVAYR